MQQFFLGLIGIALGILGMKHVKFLQEMVGSIRWAESFFGYGGTITALRLFCLLLTIISALYLLGWI